MSAVLVATDSFAPQLEASMCRALPGTTGIAKLRRLSGAASQETWSFEAV